jgi:hypothetical protein
LLDFLTFLSKLNRNKYYFANEMLPRYNVPRTGKLRHSFIW